MESGDILWLTINVIFVVILAGAIVWGSIQWNRARKNRALTRLREEATNRNYDQAEQ